MSRETPHRDPGRRGPSWQAAGRARSAWINRAPREDRGSSQSSHPPAPPARLFEHGAANPPGLASGRGTAWRARNTPPHSAFPPAAAGALASGPSCRFRATARSSLQDHQPFPRMGSRHLAGRRCTFCWRCCRCSKRGNLACRKGRGTCRRMTDGFPGRGGTGSCPREAVERAPPWRHAASIGWQGDSGVDQRHRQQNLLYGYPDHASPRCVRRRYE